MTLVAGVDTLVRLSAGYAQDDVVIAGLLGWDPAPGPEAARQAIAP